jgi:hypothetical protein
MTLRGDDLSSLRALHVIRVFGRRHSSLNAVFLYSVTVLWYGFPSGLPNGQLSDEIRMIEILQFTLQFYTSKK